MPAPSSSTTFGWKSSSSVADWLYAEPYRFEFTQAVRLLEIVVAYSRGDNARETAQAALGEGPDPARERLKLRAAVGFGFPPQEIADLVPAPGPGETPELVANFFALAGGRSTLPDWVAELLLQQERIHDTALRDFLDIFHHRLLSLRYRLRLHHRPWLDPALSLPASDHPTPGEPRARNRMAQRLFSFMGLAQQEVRAALTVPEGELLPYAGLLWHQPRSAEGLRRLLEHALAIPVAVRQHMGVWRRLEPEDRTLLGTTRIRSKHPSTTQTGTNNVLGRTAVLGRRVWDASGRFDLILGPLKLATFESLLPGGENHSRLQALVRFYAGDLVYVHLQLHLGEGEARKLRLGRSRISQTTWFTATTPTPAQHVVVPLLS